MTRRDDGRRPGQPRGRGAIEQMDRRLASIFDRLGEAIEEAAGRLARRDGTAGDGTTQDESAGGSPLRTDARIAIRLGGLAGSTERAEGDARPAAAPTRPRNGTSPPRRLEPEVTTDGSDLHVTAVLPGAAHQDLRLEVADGRLAVETEGRFRYRFSIPVAPGISLDDVEASLVNGILELRVAGGGRAP